MALAAAHQHPYRFPAAAAAAPQTSTKTATMDYRPRQQYHPGAVPGTMSSSYTTTTSSGSGRTSSMGRHAMTPSSASTSRQSQQSTASSSAVPSSSYSTGHTSRPSLHDAPALHSHRSTPALATTAASQISSTIIESPVVATNSVANRLASSASGLYQTCVSLRRSLRRVPGFSELYLDTPLSPCDDNDGDYRTASSTGATASRATSTDNLLEDITSPTTASLPALNAITASQTSASTAAADPVNQVIRCLRLGASLCYLFNALGPPSVENPLQVDPDPNLGRNKKACQKGAAHFCMALKTQLRWHDDDIFRVSELYAADTNGTVKVIHTVVKFIALLEQNDRLMPEDDDQDEATTAGSAGARGQVLRELVETERKHVQDLEALQRFKNKLADDGQISQDTIAKIFLNLDWIVDFSRKLLIDIEKQHILPPEQQRYGSLFVRWKEEFLKCYMPYIVSYATANQIINDLLAQEGENTPLARVSHVLSTGDLLMLHPKPMQRITKYALLLESLLKFTDPSAPDYADIQDGIKVTKDIIANVNEEKRNDENRTAFDDLVSRVEDWKGHKTSHFGDLLLQDQFIVIKGAVEREYHVFLFQRILLCCKEFVLPTDKSKKNSKSNSMIRKSAGSISGQPAKARKAPYQLKGRIFINNIIRATPSVRNNTCQLTVAWRGDNGEEHFIIKCRQPDILNQWAKAIDEAVVRLATQSRQSNSSLSSDIPMSARRLASPHSQFPNTPQSELGPMLGSYHSLSGHLQPTHSSASITSNGSLSQHPGGQDFYDEGEDGYAGDYEPSTGRSTPSLLSDRGASARRGPGTQSLPPNLRQQLDRDSGRPRAQTEDSNSALINQWRSQTPNGGYPPAVPPMPRTSSAAAMQQQDLRSSAGRNALRTKQSQDWGNILPGTSSSTSSNSLSTVTGDRQLLSQSETLSNEPIRMLRQGSQGSIPVHATAPPMRSRSASSPHVYQLQPGQLATIHQQQETDNWSPYPTDQVHPSHFSPVRPGLPHQHTTQGIPFKKMASANLSSATIASTNGSATSGPPKRLSSSSTGTDRSSGDSAASGHQFHPILPSTGSHRNHPIRSTNDTPQPVSPAGAAVKVKLVHNNKDTFTIMLPFSITYQELVEKIARKVSLCGARNGQDTAQIASSLRVRYEDDDQDRILLMGDEDVAMAFDWFRSSPAVEPGASLIMYAD